MTKHRPTEHRCRSCNKPVSDGDQCKCWAKREAALKLLQRLGQEAEAIEDRK